MRVDKLIVLLVFVCTASSARGQEVAVTGAIAKSDALKVLKASAGRVQACYDDRLKTAPTLEGKLVLQLVVTAAGTVRAATVDSSASSVRDTALAACVTGVLKGLKFPKPNDGKEARVTCGLSFSPPAVEAQPPAAPPDAKVKGKEGKSEAEKRDKAGESAKQPTAVTNAAPEGRTGPAAAPSEDDRARRGAGDKAAAPAPSVVDLAGEIGGLGVVSGGSAAGGGGDAAASAGSTSSTGLPAPSTRPPPPPPRPDSSKPADATAKPPPAEPAPKPSPGMSGRTPPVSAPALKAGRYDDNTQYNRFLAFMAEHRAEIACPVDVSERLVIQVLDKNGKSLPNCTVLVKDLAGVQLARSVTVADGKTHFFPAAMSSASAKDFVVTATCGEATRNSQMTRAGRRVNELRFDFSRQVPQHMPVDIAIVLDTTGSMGGQIDRLKKTLQAIHYLLTELPTKPDIRFALVAYRDRGDDYVTQVTSFTGDVDAFQRKLDALYADGGGDTPEDLQAALADAMKKLEWRKDALRLGFVVADAVPHTDYKQEYDYRSAMRESLERGVKWTMVGAGGLPVEGEVIFRQIAQYTMAEYVFVTEGGGGDAEGGTGEASHHVGANYATENLDQAIVRIVRRELSYLTDDPKDFDYTIVASGTKSTPRDEVLAPAVAEALRQLVDYSSIRLGDKTPVAVLPVTSETAGVKDVAGYLSDQLMLVATRQPTFKVVERDLNALMQEHKLQLSDMFDLDKSVPFGKLVGAELLVVAKLSVHGDEADLFAKLVRVETGEVLSAAKVRLTGGIAAGS